MHDGGKKIGHFDLSKNTRGPEILFLSLYEPLPFIDIFKPGSTFLGLSEPIDLARIPSDMGSGRVARASMSSMLWSA